MTLNNEVHTYVLTPDGWKPAKWIEYEHPKWYAKPLIWFFDKLFAPKEHVHFIPRLPIGLELSDGDRAKLYGWPDCYVQEVMRNDEC